MDDVSADLGIDKRWLRPHDKKKKAMRYLCHRDNKDKFQYDSNEIYGSIAEEAMKQCAISVDGERDNIAEIVTLLKGIDGRVTYSDFISICCDRGLWSALRRMGTLSCRLIDEHNALHDYREHRAADIAHFVDHMNKPVDDFAVRCERLEKMGFPPESF